MPDLLLEDVPEDLIAHWSGAPLSTVEVPKTSTDPP
jgi:hypothetical protein